jgi:hypothetical protein
VFGARAKDPVVSEYDLSNRLIGLLPFLNATTKFKMRVARESPRWRYAVTEETRKAAFEARIEALIAEAREDGLDEDTISEILAEAGRKLREGHWRGGPAV